MKYFSAKFIIPVISIILVIFTVVYSGPLFPQTNHTTASSTPYTLSDINNFILNTATTTGLNHSVSTTSSPTNTFVSISDIYANLGNLIQQERIRTGVKYLGVTGNFAIPDESRFVFSTSSKSLTPTNIPQSTGFSLGDLQLLLDSENSATTTSSTHAFSNSAQVASSMYSLSQVYNDLLTLISPENVATGTTYLGVTGTYFPTIPNLVAHYKMNDSSVTSGTESETGSLGTGLVAHYLMNDNADNTTVVNNIQSEDGDGIATQNTSNMTTVGVVNNALSFDGINTYISIPSNNFPTQDFSLSLWLKRTDTVGMFEGIFGPQTWTNGNMDIRIQDDKLNWYIYEDPEATFSTTLFDEANYNKWFHLVFSRTSGGTKKIYVNGVEEGSSVTSSGDLTWGSYGFGSTYDMTRLFKGAIDDIRIYNRALSQSEIDLLVTSGTRVVDSSGNANHGTAVQDTQTISTMGKVNSALSFNGFDQDVIFANSIFGEFNAISIAAWVKTTTESVGVLIGNFAAWTNTTTRLITIGNLGVFQISEESGADYNATLTFANDGTWHHLVGTWDGTTVKIYQDGVLSETTATTPATTVSDSSSPFRIGSHLSGGMFYGQSVNDDIRIYDRALTEQEVKTLYFFGDGTEEEGAGEI